MMAFRARSEQYRALGRLSLPAGLFGINEPLTYGVPLVFNIVYAIPYILALGYFLISIGLLPRPSGATMLGMPVPIFFAGLIQGSWELGLFQIGLLLLDTVIYLPFFRAGDLSALKEEKAILKGK